VNSGDRIRDIRKERIVYLKSVRNFAKEKMPYISKLKVLDAGCGNGAFLRAIKSVYPSIAAVGIDKEGARIKEALYKEKKRRLGINYAVCQIEKLPFKAASFDAVIIALVLHEVSSAARAQMIAEASRVLKKRGRLVVVDGINESREIRKLMASSGLGSITTDKFNEYDNAYVGSK
jgi:ubiquinone/menaquinone biosynthesis C-methylase UbiE